MQVVVQILLPAKKKILTDTEISASLLQVASSGATVVVMYDRFALSGNFMELVAAHPGSLAGQRSTREGMLWYMAGDEPNLESISAFQLGALYGTIANGRVVNKERINQTWALLNTTDPVYMSAVFQYDTAMLLVKAIHSTIAGGFNPLRDRAYLKAKRLN